MAARRRADHGRGGLMTAQRDRVTLVGGAGNACNFYVELPTASTRRVKPLTPKLVLFHDVVLTFSVVSTS